jgi:hypothetical protein
MMDETDYRKMAEAAFEVLNEHLGLVEEPEVSDCGKFPEIKETIFDDPYTTVKFSDGTQTTVKVNVAGGDVFSEEQGILQCVFKRAYGTPSTNPKMKGRYEFSGEPMKKALKAARHPKEDAKKSMELRQAQKDANIRKCEEAKAKAAENRAKRGPSIRSMLKDVKTSLETLLKRP